MVLRIKYILAALLVFASGAYAANTDLTVTSGTATLAITEYDVFGPTNLYELRFAWTSDSAGRVTLTTASRFSGEILRVTTNPGGTAPTDNYDILANDADGFDLLAGKGANRDTANTEAFTPLIGDGTTTDKLVAMHGTINVLITNAGASKVGELILLVRRK